MNTIYETTYHVGVINTDLFGLCRPSSVMDFMQEAAVEHTIHLGIGQEDLLEKHAIWMLVRLRYTLHRPIYGGEDLTVKTWGRPPRGAFVVRDFLLYVGQECVGEAVSVWVLGDAENHKLLRAEDILPPEGAHQPEHPTATATPTTPAMPTMPATPSPLKPSGANICAKCRSPTARNVWWGKRSGCCAKRKKKSIMCAV